MRWMTNLCILVKQGLAEMWKTCETKKKFGSHNRESVIANKKTGETVFLKRERGSSVLAVKFVDAAF